MEVEPLELAERIKSLMRLRRARDDAFDDKLFSDPAWDILLELFSAEIGHRAVTVAQLNHIAPATVVARWVAVLVSGGIVVTQGDLGPEARLYLSGNAVTKMRMLFSGRGSI